MVFQHFLMPGAGIHMGVYLRRGDALVSEHFLDHAQVRTVLDQVGREGVPQGMRRYRRLHAGDERLLLYHLEDGLPA